MNEPSLLLRVEPLGGGVAELRSPAVGWWTEAPRAGTVVGPGSPAGRLRSLNRSYLLIVPDGVTGRVVRTDGARTLAVGFGEPLFRVEALSAADPGTDPSASIEDSGSLPTGARVVRCPTDGVFYRRPSPDAAPFVEVGQQIRSGQPVGLVEVMKTFNQILYEGPPDLPEQAEVVEIRCDDGAEVDAGQILLVVR